MEEFKALERIKNKFIDFFHEDVPDFDILEQALTELKAIKEAKPSEALKYLEEIKESMKDANGHVNLILKLKFKVIKRALLKAQDLEKENEILRQAMNYEIR